MFRVTGNRLLIKRIDDPGPKSSLIHVVTLDKEPGQYAIVVGVGAGQRLPNGNLVPIDVRVDDIVILQKYSGYTVSLTGKDGNEQDFQIVSADDVLAVVEKPAPIPVVK